jgi:aryl-alcohol dehydrogenase-like predicted oxidoreductase
MGCWPIAGITSIDVTEADSLATLAAAVDAGVNFFDTAYCYGYDGESERMVGRVLRPLRDRVVIATKGGIAWNEEKKQVRDGRPTTLQRQCDESLARLGVDVIDLHYLHGPDPSVPVAESAGAFRTLLDAGKIRSVGVSNFSLEQLQEFHAECPISAFQPHYNMLQREIETDQLPWCVQNNVSAIIYWPLMKGLLAGKLPRDHQFDPRDGRRKYPMFHGEEWERNQDFLDQLRTIAHDVGASVAQLVLAWTIQRPGITAALCGAKRPGQIRENAPALHLKLAPETIARIDAAIAARGPIVSRAAVT